MPFKSSRQKYTPVVHCKKHKKQNYNHNPNIVQRGNSKYKRKNKEKKENK